MNVLVIGGTGLISGPVVRALQGRGWVVTIFHRGITPADRALPRGVVELRGDRDDPASFGPVLRAAGPWDAVVDMIGGTELQAQSLIEAVRDRTQQVVACSTTSVYGRPFATVPVTETAACRPTFPYGRNKLAFEEALRAGAAAGGFELTIVRPGHTYGETSKIVHSLGNRTSHLDRLAQGRPIIVHDDGQGQWSAAWTDDVAAAIAAAAGSPQAFGRTYHLAGAEWITWDNYHRTLARALGAPEPRMVHVPAEQLARLAPARTQQCLRTLRYPGVYDCSAATRDLGYRPQVTLAEGFARNVAGLHERGLIEDWQSDPEYEQLVDRCQRRNR